MRGEHEPGNASDPAWLDPLIGRWVEGHESDGPAPPMDDLSAHRMIKEALGRARASPVRGELRGVPETPEIPSPDRVPWISPRALAAVAVAIAATFVAFVAGWSLADPPVPGVGAEGVASRPARASPDPSRSPSPPLEDPGPESVGALSGRSGSELADLPPAAPGAELRFADARVTPLSDGALRLEAGAMLVRIDDPEAIERPQVIHLPGARVAVFHGAVALEVRVEAPLEYEVRVHEGRARWHSLEDGSSLALASGQSLGAGPSPGTHQLRPRPATAEALARDEARFGPIAAGVPAPAAPAAAHAKPPATPPDRRAADPGAPAAAQMSAGELFAAATRLRTEGRWRAAVTALADLRRAYPASSEACTALIPTAEIYLDHLANPRRAELAFERYLADCAHGPLAEEARFGQARAARGRGRPQDERSALERFLKLHPGSARAVHAQLRLGDLARARGDCQAARAAYEGVLAASPGAKLAQAAAEGRSACDTKKD